MLYLVISIFSFLGILVQNCNTSERYIIGDMSAKAPCHNAWFFVGKAVYIIFWTWLLNILCRGGASWISWLIALFPIILFFILLSTLFLSNMAIV